MVPYLVKIEEQEMQQGSVRIIAGKWRGRKLKVLDQAGLRPTPDRVRETIFNWLAPYIVGAHCLDAFAGSGALGVEALSRGAGYVALVDQSKEVVDLLQAELSKFEAENVQIYQANVPEQLKAPIKPFDIVFLDPPFQEKKIATCCAYLEEHGYLADSAQIYLEAQEIIKDNDLPPNWRIEKSKQAGQVYYHLAHRERV